MGAKYINLVLTLVRRFLDSCRKILELNFRFNDFGGKIQDLSNTLSFTFVFLFPWWFNYENPVSWSLHLNHNKLFRWCLRPCRSLAFYTSHSERGLYKGVRWQSYRPVGVGGRLTGASASVQLSCEEQCQRCWATQGIVDQAWTWQRLGAQTSLPLYISKMRKYSSFIGRRVEGGYEREGKAGAQVTLVTQVEHMQGNSPGLRICICGRVIRKTVAGINNMGS